ncbi:MAG: hypothetical protein K2J69_02630 [Malacoplasma sp.]|nr:hypothetical protein [Malacoplasma sp.]MDE6894226.1 hypothetical protein [Malacoplasma sp.]MDE7075230.1 hypothetical protein [Malacoplasma sp.]
MSNFDSQNNDSFSSENMNSSNLEVNSENNKQDEQLICLFKGKRRGGRGAHRRCDEKCLVPISVYKQQLIASGNFDPDNKFICKYLKNGNVPFNHNFCTPICFKEAKYLPISITKETAKNIKNKAILILVLTILWVCLAIISIVVGTVLNENETTKICAIVLGCIAIIIWLVKNIILIILKNQLNIRSFNAADYDDYTEPVFVTRSFSKNFKLTGLLCVPLFFSFIWNFVGGGFFWSIAMFFVAIAFSVLALGYSILSSIFYGLYTSIYLIKNVKADA